MFLEDIKMMSPEEFAKKMQEIAEECGGDCEASHSTMDDLMCQVLRELGYDEGVEIFEDTEKWYC